MRRSLLASKQGRGSGSDHVAAFERGRGQHLHQATKVARREQALAWADEISAEESAASYEEQAAARQGGASEDYYDTRLLDGRGRRDALGRRRDGAERSCFE